MHIRDSKTVTGPVIRVSRKTWAGFVGSTSSERDA
ncbi:DUF397 domain-containing protein [Streptomyces sp. NPDC086182]